MDPQERNPCRRAWPGGTTCHCRLATKAWSTQAETLNPKPSRGLLIRLRGLGVLFKD